MKTLEQLAFETVMPDGGETTEHQEAEIAALVKFGKLVLENASLPTKRAPDGAKCLLCLGINGTHSESCRNNPANTASQVA